MTTSVGWLDSLLICRAASRCTLAFPSKFLDLLFWLKEARPGHTKGRA